MAWYKTGTVTVTNGSVTVTGAGTAFVGSVLAGQGFAAPDGKIYEIEAVVSATGLTLASPYLGATAAGAVYTILPTIGGLSAFASRLDTLLTAMQGVVDGAGQGKFGAGTPEAPGLRFTADGDTGLTNPAANQIGMVAGGVLRALLSGTAFNLNVPMTGTAVTQTLIDTTSGRLMKVGDFGLGSAYPTYQANLDTLLNTLFSTAGASTIGVPIASGNWAAISVPIDSTRMAQIALRSTGELYVRAKGSTGIWSAWNALFGRTNILGAVAQAAGVPTGALIERGSNANGEYIRFADGTQICWIPVSPGSSKALGAGTYADPWRTTDFGATYPAVFAAPPAVSGVIQGNENSVARHHALTVRFVNNATFSQANLVRLSGNTAEVSPTVTLIFQGRWF